MSDEDARTEDLAAALAAHRELGAGYDKEIAAALAEKLEREVAAQVRARLAAQEPIDRSRSADARWTALGSLAIGVPVTGFEAAAGTDGGHLAAIALTWLGIGVVNLAVALGRRRR